MEVNASLQDKLKWAEFHSPEFVRTQIQVKRMMQAGLIKALDELTELINSNTEKVRQLQVKCNQEKAEAEVQIISEAIAKFDNLTILANKVCEIYLVLLDVNTYGTYCLLSDDEWEWRAFARHIYTIIYEHTESVNKHINDIVRILKAGVDEGYDLTNLLNAKKEYAKYINNTSQIAKPIRVKTDAHFDSPSSERLSLIKELSYSSVLELYYTYTSKMQAFLHELKPALDNFRITVDTVYNSIK